MKPPDQTNKYRRCDWGIEGGWTGRTEAGRRERRGVCGWGQIYTRRRATKAEKRDWGKSRAMKPGRTNNLQSLAMSVSSRRAKAKQSRFKAHAHEAVAVRVGSGSGFAAGVEISRGWGKVTWRRGGERPVGGGDGWCLTRSLLTRCGNGELPRQAASWHGNCTCSIRKPFPKVPFRTGTLRLKVLSILGQRLLRLSDRWF